MRPYVKWIPWLNSCSARFAVICGACVLFPIFITPLVGQSIPDPRGSQSRIYGTEDADIHLPPLVGPLGVHDPQAIKVIQGFLATTNCSEWHGFKGSGNFTASDVSTSQQYAATLDVSGSDSFRLDVALPNGVRSIRIYKHIGAIREDNRGLSSIPPTAAKLGLFSFPALMAGDFSKPDTSLLDGGLTSIDGTTMHLITFEEAITTEKNAVPSQRIAIVDLYFSTSTNLLIKSAISTHLTSHDATSYLQTITYGDYRPVGGMLIPYLYAQSLNGQHQWTLQLTQAELHSYSDPAHFRF